MDFSVANPYSWTREHLNEVVLNGKHQIIKDPNLSEAFRKIDRADFLPENLKSQAYNDTDLEISYGQKINKPTTIAQQLSLLQPKPGGKYLEIGAGSGYAAAILGKVAGEEGKVIALDRILLLIEDIRKNLESYPELDNIVEIVFKDGRDGYPSEAPFDGILASVAYSTVPEDLKTQLKVGGRLVAPTKDNDIRIIIRTDKDNFREEVVEGFVFDEVSEGVE